MSLDSLQQTHRRVLAVIFLNLAVMGLAGYFLYSSRQVHEAGAFTTTQNLALTLERELTGILATVDFSLKVLGDDFAEKLEERSFPLQEWNKGLQRQREYLPVLSGLRGADTQGRVVWGLSPGDPQSASIADRDYFIAHRKNPNLGLLISQPILGRVTKQWSLVLSRRLNARDGSFAGIIAATIPLERFRERFALLNLGEQGSVGVRDTQLRLILRQPALPNGGEIGSIRIGKEFTEALAHNAALGSYRVGQTSIDGILRYHSYRRNDEFGFYLNVGVGVDESLAPWFSQLYLTLAFVITFLLTTTALFIRLQRNWYARQHAMEQLAQSEADFRLLADNAPYGLVVLNPNNRIDYINPAITHMLGYVHGDIPDVATWWPKAYPDPTYREKVMEAWRELLTNNVCEPLERIYTVCGSDGRNRDIRFNVVKMHDRRIIVTFEDITERRIAEREIENLAFFDSLTGLPNRRLLIDRLQHSMAASSRSGHYRALLFIDLDHFKQLNDTQGHDIGDRLLVQTARRIETCVREGDTVARLGGDEFIILLEQLSREVGEAADQAGIVGEKIIAHMNQPCDLGSVFHQCSCSIGITLFVGQEQSTDEVLKRADMAMYQAKSSGRNTLCFFDPVMQSRVSAHVALERELRTALDAGQFRLHYQPQVDLHGTCIGVEALIRWEHPGRGLVSPQTFIPVAEETGIIVPLGNWVLREACAQLALWQSRSSTATLTLSVNVSVRQFKQPDFVDTIRAALAMSKADPRGLKIEITESLLAENLDQVIAKMEALGHIGVSFALDDFGTGYSSLTYLKQLPFDELKIDRSFVRDITLDPNDAAICRAIIALGKTLGLDIIAEGVETTTQWSILNSEGCTFAQGFLFARPMPAGELDDWLLLKHFKS